MCTSVTTVVVVKAGWAFRSEYRISEYEYNSFLTHVNINSTAKAKPKAKQSKNV